jgi:hypothetical protein
VAIHAFGECQWFLEISASMALHAAHAGVFSKQRELRFRVIECLIERAVQNIFPAAGAVA